MIWIYILEFMKENIIMAVVTAMQRDLDCRQMARLKAVLIKELQNVEISECKGTEQQRQDSNNDLLAGCFYLCEKDRRLF